MLYGVHALEGLAITLILMNVNLEGWSPRVASSLADDPVQHGEETSSRGKQQAKGAYALSEWVRDLV